MVLVFAESSLPVLVLSAGTPEVTSPPRDERAVAVADPNVRSLASSLALELVVASAGRITAEEAAPTLVIGALSERPVAEVTARERRSDSSLALEMIVVPAGGTTAEETTPAVVSEGLLRPWVATFTPVVVS